MIQPRGAIERFLLALALVGMARGAWAEYDPISFCDLAGTSDVIATGEIVEVGGDTFNFQVDKVFAGEVAPHDRLEIGKFHDWPCAWRWGPYGVGERLFVFLDVNEVEGKKKFQIRGAGDEGELSIVTGQVYVQPFTIEQEDSSIEYAAARLGGGLFVKVPYRTFRDCIVGFRQCFEIAAADDRRTSSESPANFSSIQQLCDDGEVVAFCQACSLNRRLVDELKYEYELTVRQYGPQTVPALAAVEKIERVSAIRPMNPPSGSWTFRLPTLLAVLTAFGAWIGWTMWRRRIVRARIGQAR